MRKVLVLLVMLLVGFVGMLSLAAAEDGQQDGGVPIEHLVMFGNGAAVRQISEQDWNNLMISESTRQDYLADDGSLVYSIYLAEDMTTFEYKVIIAFPTAESGWRRLQDPEKKGWMIENAKNFLGAHPDDWGIQLADNYGVAFQQYREHLDQGQVRGLHNVGIIIPASYAHAAS